MERYVSQKQLPMKSMDVKTKHAVNIDNWQYTGSD